MEKTVIPYYINICMYVTESLCCIEETKYNIENQSYFNNNKHFKKNSSYKQINNLMLIKRYILSSMKMNFQILHFLDYKSSNWSFSYWPDNHTAEESNSEK